MPVELLQHFFSFPSGSAQIQAPAHTVAESPGLPDGHVQRIEMFCSPGVVMVPPELLPPSYNFFRLEADSFCVSRTFGFGKRVVVHSLAIDQKSFRALGSNCFKLFSQANLFAESLPVDGAVPPPLAVDISAADDFNWLEPLTGVPSESSLVALINAGVLAGKNERPLIVVPPDPDAGFKILRALLLCMPRPLREMISIATFRTNHFDSQSTWLAVSDEADTQLTEMESKYHYYEFNFLDNRFSQVDGDCAWGQTLAPLILDRDFARVGELVAQAQEIDVKDALAALNRISAKGKPAAAPVRKMEEGPAAPDLGQLVDALGKTEQGRKMLLERFQQYLGGALKGNQAPTIVALARAFARCVPRTSEPSLKTAFARLVGATLEQLVKMGHIEGAAVLTDEAATLDDAAKAEVSRVFASRAPAAFRQHLQEKVQGPAVPDLMLQHLDLVTSLLQGLPSTEVAGEWLVQMVEAYNRAGWLRDGWRGFKLPLEDGLGQVSAPVRRRVVEAAALGLIAGGLLDEYPSWLTLTWVPCALEAGGGIVSGLQEVGFFNFVVATANQDAFLALLDALRKHPEEIPDFFRTVFGVAGADPTGRLRQICLDSIEEDPTRMERDYQLLLGALSQAGEFSEYKAVLLVNWLPRVVASSGAVAKKLRLNGYPDVLKKTRDPGLVNAIIRELQKRPQELQAYHQMLHEIATDDPSLEQWMLRTFRELAAAFSTMAAPAEGRRGADRAGAIFREAGERLKSAYEADEVSFPASLLMTYNELLAAETQGAIAFQAFLFDSLEQFSGGTHPNCATLVRIHQDIVKRGNEDDLIALLPTIASRVVTRPEFLDRAPHEQNSYLEYCVRTFPHDPMYQNWLDLCAELYDIAQVLAAVPPVMPGTQAFGCFLMYQGLLPQGLLQNYVHKALNLFSGRNDLKLPALKELVDIFDLDGYPDLLENLLRTYLSGVNWSSPDLPGLADLAQYLLSDGEARQWSFVRAMQPCLVRLQPNPLKEMQGVMAPVLRNLPSSIAEAWNGAVEEELKRRKSQGVLGFFRRR